MLRPCLFALALSLLPLGASAQSLPDLYDVTGVAANDMLNVRAFPDAKASVLGELPPDARGLEVLALDPSGKWAQVNMGEQAGWVSTRFIKARPTVWVPGRLPETLSCSGTEPFWSLRQKDGGLVLSQPDAGDRALTLRTTLDRGFEGDRMRALIAGDGAGRLTAVIQPDACSDGMSDRSFGLSGTLILDGSGTSSRMLTGCCSITPR